jgi:hypothetical protein
MRYRLFILIALLLTALAVGSTASGRATSKEEPWPRTAAQAIALVRANPRMNDQLTPFERVLGWYASWRGDRWWVVGLFKSPWSARFVGDASIIHHRVYAHLDYTERPSQKWVKAAARRSHWHLHRFYTRFPNSKAIHAAEKGAGIDGTQPYTVLDAAAELVEDSPKKVAWYFAVYVQAPEGTKSVYTITGLGPGDPVVERIFADGYGFGSQPTLDTTVPPELRRWVRSVSAARGWQPSNL